MKYLTLLIFSIYMYSCCEVPPKDIKMQEGKVRIESIQFGGKGRTILNVRLIEVGTSHSLSLGRRTRNRLNCKVGDIFPIKYYKWKDKYYIDYNREIFLK